jgi:hypothetical protein
MTEQKKPRITTPKGKLADVKQREIPERDEEAIEARRVASLKADQRGADVDKAAEALRKAGRR